MRRPAQDRSRAAPLQVKTTGTPTSRREAPIVVQEALRSPGSSLNPSTRALMEPRFGHDFGHVRIHADADADRSAKEIQASAFTVGRDIVFAAGRFAPQSLKSQHLLAHELLTWCSRVERPNSSSAPRQTIQAIRTRCRLRRSPRADPRRQISADDWIWTLETLRRQSPERFREVTGGA